MAATSKLTPAPTVFLPIRDALPYVVECRSTYPFFEAIAAFDVDTVAHKYAADCAATNPKNEYRVSERPPYSERAPRAS